MTATLCYTLPEEPLTPAGEYATVQESGRRNPRRQGLKNSVDDSGRDSMCAYAGINPSPGHGTRPEFFVAALAGPKPE